MLSDKQTKLITEYVDGELNPQQQKTVLKLVEGSPEAEKLLESLQKDSRQLAKLPKTQLPKGFPNKIMDEIASRGLQIPAPSVTTPSSAAVPQTLPNWIGLAIAATVLLAITGASYLYFSQGNADPVVKKSEPEKPNNIFKEPPPRPGRLDVSTPRMKVAIQDVAGNGFRREFKQKVRNNESLNVRLTSLDRKRSLEQLKNALWRRARIRLLEDEVLSNQAKTDQPTQTILYLDDIERDELVDVLEDLNQNETASEITTVAFSPLTDAQRGEMANVLGMDEEILQPAREKIDLLEGPMRKQKSSNGRINIKKITPEPTPRGRLALALAYDPTNPTSSESPQALRYRKSRSQRTPRAGTLQVVIVLNEFRA